MNHANGQLQKLTEAQANRLTPYVPSISYWTSYYMKQASGQQNPTFTKPIKPGNLKTQVISEVEASLDVAESELSEEKKAAASKSKTVKRKRTNPGNGRKKQKKTPADIFN